MKAQKDIHNIYTSKLRLFARTDNEKFLAQADVLREVLEITGKEEDKIFNEIMDKIKEKDLLLK